MGRELIKIVELDASPEQVWQAIATGPGISTWFVPHQVEPRAGGAMSAQFGGGADVTGRVEVWEPERRFGFRAAEPPPDGAADYAFEFLVEGRDGGGTVLRFVQSGFLDEGWEDEYSSFDAGWDLFFGNLRSYFAHFAGQPVHNVVTMSFTAGAAADIWPVLYRALGLAGRPAVGDTVTLRPDGPPPITGVVDVATVEVPRGALDRRATPDRRRGRRRVRGQRVPLLLRRPGRHGGPHRRLAGLAGRAVPRPRTGPELRLPAPSVAAPALLRRPRRTSERPGPLGACSAPSS